MIFHTYVKNISLPYNKYPHHLDLQAGARLRVVSFGTMADRISGKKRARGDTSNPNQNEKKKKKKTKNTNANANANKNNNNRIQTQQPEVAVEETAENAVATCILPFAEAMERLVADDVLAHLNGALVKHLERAVDCVEFPMSTIFQCEKTRIRTKSLIEKVVQNFESIHRKTLRAEWLIEQASVLQDSRPDVDDAPKEQWFWTCKYLNVLCGIYTIFESTSKFIAEQIQHIETFMRRKELQKTGMHASTCKTINDIVLDVRSRLPIQYLAEDPTVRENVCLILAAPLHYHLPVGDGSEEGAVAIENLADSRSSSRLEQLVSKFVCLKNKTSDLYYGEYSTLTDCFAKIKATQAKINSTNNSTLWEDLLNLPEEASPGLCDMAKHYIDLLKVLTIVIKPPWESRLTVEEYLATTTHLTVPRRYVDKSPLLPVWELLTHPREFMGTPADAFENTVDPILFGKHTRNHFMSAALRDQIREDITESDISFFTLVDMRDHTTRAAIDSYLELQALYPGIFPRSVCVQYLTPIHCLIETVHCTDRTLVSADLCLAALLASKNPIVTTDDGHIETGGAVNFYAGLNSDDDIRFFDEDSTWLDRISTIASVASEKMTGFDIVSVRYPAKGSPANAPATVLGITPLSWIEGVHNRRQPSLSAVLADRMALLRETFVNRWPMEDHCVYVPGCSHFKDLDRDSPKMYLIDGKNDTHDTLPENDQNNVVVVVVDDDDDDVAADGDASVPLMGIYALLQDRGVRAEAEALLHVLFPYVSPQQQQPGAIESSFDECKAMVPGLKQWVYTHPRRTCVFSVLISNNPYVRRMSFLGTPTRSESWSVVMVNRLRTLNDTYGVRNLSTAVWGACASPPTLIIKDIMDICGEFAGCCIRSNQKNSIDIIGVLRLLVSIGEYRPDALALLPVNFLSHCQWSHRHNRFAMDAAEAWFTNSSGLTVADALKTAATGEIKTVAAYILREICRQVRDVCATQPDNDGMPNTASCINYGDVEFCRLFGAIKDTSIRGDDDVTFLRRITESPSLLLTSDQTTKVRSYFWSTALPDYFAACKRIPRGLSNYKKHVVTVPAEFVDGTVDWQDPVDGLVRVRLLLDFLESFGKSIISGEQQPPPLSQTHFVVDYTTVLGPIVPEERGQVVGASSGVGVTAAVCTGLLAATNYMLRTFTGGKLMVPYTYQLWSDNQLGALFHILMEAHLVGNVDTSLALDFTHFPSFTDQDVAPNVTVALRPLASKCRAGLVATSFDGESIVQEPLADPFSYLDQNGGEISTFYVEASAISNARRRAMDGHHASHYCTPTYNTLGQYLCTEYMDIYRSMPAYLMHRFLCTPPTAIDADRVISQLCFEAFCTGSRMPDVLKMWIRTLSSQELRQFCFFVTGSRILSPGVKLTIARSRGPCDRNNLDRLPVSTTCTRLLVMPDYDHILRKARPTVSDDYIMQHLDQKMRRAFADGALLLG